MRHSVNWKNSAYIVPSGCQTPIQKNEGCNHMTVSSQFYDVHRVVLIATSPSASVLDATGLSVTFILDGLRSRTELSHFCYLCGGLVIKTDGTATGVSTAVANHFSAGCALFGVPDED